MHQSIRPQPIAQTNQKEDNLLAANQIVPSKTASNQNALPQTSANQRASLPTNEETTITDKRQINEDLQVYKMENGTRSKFFLFSYNYFPFPVNSLYLFVIFKDLDV